MSPLRTPRHDAAPRRGGSEGGTAFAATCFALHGSPSRERNARPRSGRAPVDLLAEVAPDAATAGKRRQGPPVPAAGVPRKPPVRVRRPQTGNRPRTADRGRTRTGPPGGRRQLPRRGGKRGEARPGPNRQRFRRVALFPQDHLAEFLRAVACRRRTVLAPRSAGAASATPGNSPPNARPRSPNAATRPAPTPCGWPNASDRPPATDPEAERAPVYAPLHVVLPSASEERPGNTYGTGVTGGGPGGGGRGGDRRQAGGEAGGYGSRARGGHRRTGR